MILGSLKIRLIVILKYLIVVSCRPGLSDRSGFYSGYRQTAGTRLPVPGARLPSCTDKHFNDLAVLFCYYH